jgi:outer membrane protein insertion porin family
MWLKRNLSMILPIILFLPAFLVHTAWCHSSFNENGKSTAAPSDKVIARIGINLGDLPDDTRELIQLARDLIVLKEGEPFSPDSLERSIEALKLSKRFGEIHVDSRQEERGIALLFSLKPFQLIKDIRIYGEFPLFEREILRAMTILVGDIYTNEELSKQGTLIAEVFKREGFIEPKVTVTAEKDSQDGNVIIRVSIEKGSYLTVGQITTEGNRAFSDAMLKSKMKIWRATLLPGTSGRFIKRDLYKDIERLVSYYRKSEYPDVVIDHKTDEPVTRSLSVLILINEGPRYVFGFVGNRTFKDSTLRKDLLVLREGNKNDLGLKKSIKKIQQRYRKSGFLEAQVKIEGMVADEKGEAVRTVRFVINEGPRSVVKSIQFRGNQAFDDAKLKKQMLTRVPGFREKGIFLPETLDEDINAITSLYRKHGYIVRIVKEVKWSADQRTVEITLEIEEKVQALVSSLKIAGLTVISEEEARGALRMKVGEPFRRYMVQSDENALSALISKKGYPHVTIKGEVSVSQDKSNVQITHYIDEGPYVTMGHVYCMGNFKTRNSIIRREFQMEPGEPFSLVKMLQSQRNIRNLGIFDSVRFRVIGLKEKRDQVHLLVGVEEKKPYFVEAGGGYETDRGFYLHARAGDRNLFGTKKDAWIAGEISQIGYRSELGITEPRLFGTQIATTFGLYSERKEEFNQDFGTTSFGASLGFSRKWLRHTYAGLNFRFERREQYRRDPLENTTYLEDDAFQARRIFVTTPSIRYDTRDSFIRPRKGILSSFSINASKGISSSRDDFLKYRYDIRYYVTPLSRLTLAWLGRAGYIDPYGETERIPDDQLFYLGGTSSIRGFDENLLSFDEQGDPVGGRSAVAGSMESRIDLGRNLELALFYDIGCVDNMYVESVSEKTRSSVGVGLRYITPIGAMGFLYGRKLDPEDGESLGRLHFSIGYTF